MPSVLVLILLLVAPPGFAQTGQQWITNASGVRARSLAATTGEEVARLPLGTILKQVDNEQRAGEVNNKSDFWYHVALPNGKAGWVFGSFLTEFDEARKASIYHTLAATRIKAESASFADYADLTRFIATALPAITDRAQLAEMELWRWLSLQKAFNNIESDKQQQPDYQRFLKAHQAYSVYSEPGGLWLVKAEMFWNLQKKYADLPLSETIAWEAATQSLPGECEGDDVCAMDYMNQTEGRYLQLYPTGPHAAEALEKLSQSLESMIQFIKEEAANKGKGDPQARKEALAGSAKLRANVARVTNPKKTKLLGLLAQYEKLYR